MLKNLKGSSGPILHVSNMVGGDYSFTLRVTDSGGQTSDSRVTVVVRPEQNSPPVAKGGDDKDLVFPDDSTTLNAKDSSDDQGIASYKWEKLRLICKCFQSLKSFKSLFISFAMILQRSIFSNHVWR